MAQTENRLIHDKSPYLLQHAHNPVDWYPWGEEAFGKARREDKPVFLSIGYSTCHWCHVMAHESFENAGVARALNETFVSIKVDREERPDIDSVYMTVCQVLTGSGGWPLTILMSADKKPFFAGTYFPPKSRFGRIGLLELCENVRTLWNSRREELSGISDELIRALNKMSVHGAGPAPGPELIDRAFGEIGGQFDSADGGFGSAPKFPMPQRILFLLRYARSRKSGEALAMALSACDAMRRGGIYDHAGGGFHRYATDSGWLVPHFEKMLYDQAMISLAFLEAYQMTGRKEYAGTAEDVFGYVLRDMVSPEGGFYSAEDADSEGVEGRYYTWSYDELDKLLDAGELSLLAAVSGIRPEGNFHDEATGKISGMNILHIKKPPHESAADLGMNEDAFRNSLSVLLKKLYDARSRRVRPHRDDKILADWNGLMIAALARGAQALGNASYGMAAQRAADFILTVMRKPDGSLLRRYRAGEAAIPGTLDDYAFLAWGLLELYEAVFDPKYLKAARELMGQLVGRFRDAGRGGFYFTPVDGEGLPVRMREVHDGPVPSGNAVAMMNLLRLGHITADPAYPELAAEILSGFSAVITEQPSACTWLMCALMFATGGSHEIVIVGDINDDATKELISGVQRSYLPDKVLLVLHGDTEARKDIGSIAPFTASFTGEGEKAAAYVCSNNTCGSPVNDTGRMFLNLGIAPPEP